MEHIPRPEIWTASAAPTNSDKQKKTKKKKKKKKKRLRHADKNGGGGAASITAAAASNSMQSHRALATLDANASLTQSNTNGMTQCKRATPTSTGSSFSSSPGAAHLLKTYGARKQPTSAKQQQQRKTGKEKKKKTSSHGKILINGVELPDEDDEGNDNNKSNNSSTSTPNAMLAGSNDILPHSAVSDDQQPSPQPPRRIFSLTDVALPSPVRSRVQVSISKQQAAAQAAAQAKAAAAQHSTVEAFRKEKKNSKTTSGTSGGSGAAAAKALRPVSAATLAAALPTHTPGRQRISPATTTSSSSRTQTSFLNTWFSRLDHAEQTAQLHQTEASAARLTVAEWEQKYKTLQQETRARDAEVHERILSFQSEVLLLKNEKASLLADMDECHAARREDAELHSRAQDKWKRREATLEATRHEAMVAASLHKSRLEEQKAHTKAAIAMNKQTKETLGAEIGRLRKMVQHDDKAAAAAHKMEIQRLEREVSRLKNEVVRVREKTKANVAAAAAAAASAAFTDSVGRSGGVSAKNDSDIGDNSGRESTVAGKNKTKMGKPVPVTSSVLSSKSRLAAASQRVAELSAQLAASEKRAAVAEEREKSARREAETAGRFVRRKTDALQKEIETLHAKLQERKRELEEAQEHNKAQREQWLVVQKSIADDAKSRRELGQLVSATEKRAREACHRADRSDNALEREVERHTQTKKELETAKERIDKLTVELSERTTTCNDLVAVSKDAASQKDAAEAELASVRIELAAAQKAVQHLEAAAQEQKELLAASTRTIRNLETNIRRVQTTHREELAESKAQVQLAKSKTVSVIDAKREMGLRYQKCVAARKDLELRLEKCKHDEAQVQRKFESERQILERRIRAIKEKTQRESHAALAKLSKDVERAQAVAAEERETHEVTHRALRSAHAELDEMHTRLAEAEAEAQRLSSQTSDIVSNSEVQSHVAYPSRADWGGGSGASPIEGEFGGYSESRASMSGRRSRRQDGNAAPGSLETTGRPPRPPGSGGKTARGSSPHETGTRMDRFDDSAEVDRQIVHRGQDENRRHEDSALLSTPSHFEQQNPRLSGILQQHSSFLEEPSLDSPGQRAAAVIMGATDFVRRRSAKRKSRKRGGLDRK